MCVIDHKNLSRENHGLRQRASRYLATLSPQPIVQLPRTYFSQSKLHVTTLTFKNTCRVFFFRQTGGWIRWRAWRWTGWWWACKECRNIHITVVCNKNVADILVSKKRCTDCDQPKLNGVATTNLIPTTLPNLSIPDAHIPVVLSNLIKSWFQVKPATFLVPIGLLLFCVVLEFYGA